MQQDLPTKIKKAGPRNHSERGDFFISRPAQLVLADGATFDGLSPDWQSGPYIGEVVFNTGMTGYTESLTDPSYAGQILVFTYPLIGNYGVNIEAAESDKIQVSGLVVSEAAWQWSHSGSDRSLLRWLSQQNIPIITGVDTRELTKHLRKAGTMAGAIGISPDRPKMILDRPKVSINEPTNYNATATKKVILIDCGTKANILRSLLELNLQIKRVPYDFDFNHEAYDGVLISNGPGDPTDYGATIAIIRQAMLSDKPIFGICLGCQLLGIAAGAMTYKLKFGHRGHNQPCLKVGTDRAYITSQNHGYALDEETLSPDWSVTFTNLNDGSVEGIEHRSKPFSGVQFHPEACPGPTDTKWLFEQFYQSL